MVSIGLSGTIRLLKQKGMGDFISRINHIPVEKNNMTPEVKKYITDYLLTDIRQLEKMFDRDLSHWLN